MRESFNAKRAVMQAAAIVAAASVMAVAANFLSPNRLPYDCHNIPKPKIKHSTAASGAVAAATATVAATTTAMTSAMASSAPAPATDVISQVIPPLAPGESPFFDFIELDKAFLAWDSKQFLFIDARPRAEYEAGRIEGAVNLHADEFDALYPTVLKDKAPDTPVILYCGGTGCELSLTLAKHLLDKGWTRMRVFYGGWNHWHEVGYPTETGPVLSATEVMSATGVTSATAPVAAAHAPKTDNTMFVIVGLFVLAAFSVLVARARGEAASNSLTLLFRILLGLLFIVASYDKIIDPAAFARVVQDYKILPCALVPVAAVILPWIEMAIGILLLLGLFTDGAALVGCSLMVAFTAGLVASIFRGFSMSCGCFDLFGIVEKIAGHKAAQQGWIEMLSTVGWPTVVRDLYFLLPAVYLLLRPNRFFSLDWVMAKTGRK